MAKHAGRDFLLKMGGGETPTEAFTTVAGQRSTGFTLNGEAIDVTDKDDNNWRKLMEGGVKTCSLSSSGLLQSAVAHAKMLKNVGKIANYQVIFAGGIKLTGPFQLASMEGSGEYTDGQQYSLTLESAGVIDIDTTSVPGS